MDKGVRIIQALAYIASRLPEQCVDNIKAYKLLWLADRYQLRRSGRFITGDVYFAMPKGPVPSNAKNILEDAKTSFVYDKAYRDMYLTLQGNSFCSAAEPNIRVFSISDREALDLVLSNYGDMTAEQLSALSHQFPEWKSYEERILKEGTKNSYEIDVNLFFEPCAADDKGFFADSEEALALSRQLYNESKCSL